MPEEHEVAAVWVRVADIRPLPTPNPRLNEEAIPAVAASIKRWGFGAPLVLTVRMGLIAGDTRMKAAELLGMLLVPARLLDISDEDAIAYRAADNRLGEKAQWCYGLLANDLRTLSEEDMGIAGFTPEDLDRMAPLSEDDFVPSGGNNPLDGGGRPISLTVAQREVFDRAADAIRRREGDDSIMDGQVCEWIAADFMAGADR